MSLDAQSQPYDYEPENPFTRAVIALDESRGHFFSQARNYVKEPSQISENTILAAGDNLEGSLMGAIRLALVDEISSENQVQVITSMLTNEAVERKMYFSTISGGDFEVGNSEKKKLETKLHDLVSEIVENADDNDDATEALLGEYLSDFHMDLHMLFKDAESTRSFRIKKLGRLIGEQALDFRRHAVDIGKISAGVVGGIAIAHYTNII